MIEYCDGNMLLSRCDILVDPVNCRGGVGGLAKGFVTAFPSIEKPYKTLCRSRQLALGRPVLLSQRVPEILFFPVKDDWRLPARLEDIESGLVATVKLLQRQPGRPSIAFPALGCGLGRLSWRDVKPLMENYLEPLPNNIELYLPKG